jgi:hypothetical protein
LIDRRKKKEETGWVMNFKHIDGNEKGEDRCYHGEKGALFPVSPSFLHLYIMTFGSETCEA